MLRILPFTFSNMFYFLPVTTKFMCMFFNAITCCNLVHLFSWHKVSYTTLKSMSMCICNSEWLMCNSYTRWWGFILSIGTGCIWLVGVLDGASYVFKWSQYDIRCIKYFIITRFSWTTMYIASGKPTEKTGENWRELSVWARVIFSDCPKRLLNSFYVLS